MSLTISNTPYDVVLHHASIGVLMVNESGTILMTNPYLNALFGYEPDELRDRPLSILIPQYARNQHAKLHQEYFRHPQNRPMGIGLALKAVKKDGSLFPVEISLCHVPTEQGTAVAAFVHDITLKEQAEADLVRKNEEIQQLNESLEREVNHRTDALIKTLKELESSKETLEIALAREKELGDLKSRFVSMASHEFRTPLTAILTATDLVGKFTQTADQPTRERYLTKIKSAVNNLTEILEEFLSVGKLEEGRVEARLESCDVEALMLDALADCRHLAKAGQTLTYTHEGKSFVYTDPSLLRKIVLNLCSNALKFSPAGTTVTVYTQQLPDAFHLRVTDTGIGISEEDQKHLFDRFFRAANAANIQGTGLGLHIVAQYTQLLQGQLSFRSVLGQGTTFYLQFPHENTTAY